MNRIDAAIVRLSMSGLIIIILNTLYTCKRLQRCSLLRAAHSFNRVATRTHSPLYGAEFRRHSSLELRRQVTTRKTDS